MKSRKLKKLLAVILCIFIVAGGAFWYAVYHYPITLSKAKIVPCMNALDNNQTLTKEQIIEDRNKMIKLVEDIHPYFLLEKNQEKYKVAKQKYLNDASEGMSVGEFQMVTSAYLNVFNDGHTSLDWAENKLLDVSWTYNKDGLYLNDEHGKITNKKVIMINSIPVEQVFQTIDSLFPAENEMSHAVNYAYYSRGALLLSHVGGEVNSSATITLEDGKQIEYGFRNNNQDYSPPRNSGEIRGDLYYVDFNTCEVNQELDNIAHDLKKAIKKGITKVIIDVRNNGGGNSNACVELVEAMGMKAPNYSSFIRFSKEAKEQRGYFRKSGSVTLNDSGDGKVNKKIHLVVLTNRYTFSSATMMAVFARDGRLGTIIGEPSSNNPCSYGDIIYFNLPNSKLHGSISHKRFLRPDNSKYSENMLVPDVEVGVDQDAYEVAVNWLENK